MMICNTFKTARNKHSELTRIYVITFCSQAQHPTLSAKFRFIIGLQIFINYIWVSGAPSLRVKRPEREADHLPPSSAAVKK